MGNKTLVVVGVLATIFFFAVFIPGCAIVGSYNGLVGSEQSVESQWGKVETQLQRRFDLVPNLVAAVQGSMTQEQAVFGEIAQARTHYADVEKSGTQEEKVQAANQYESAIARLLVVIENYPDLKSSERVHDLMVQLEGTENRISTERTRYNDEVQGYNNKVKKFPSNIVAGIFGFSEKAYFAAEDGAQTAPKVELNTNLQTPTTR